MQIVSHFFGKQKIGRGLSDDVCFREAYGSIILGKGFDHLAYGLQAMRAAMSCGFSTRKFAMRRNLDTYLVVAVVSTILVSIVLVYLPAIPDPNYQGEDYLIASQVSRVGLAKSLLLSWKDHFIPLYRLTMGGLHLLFHNAIPIRT